MCCIVYINHLQCIAFQNRLLPDIFNYLYFYIATV